MHSIQKILSHTTGEARFLKIIALATHLRERYEQNNQETKKTARVLEAIIHEYGELGDWFGENATTIKTSEYDDYVNGVDLVVELSDDDFSHHLALAVDVTFGSKHVHKKFQKIKEEIDAEKLAEVKYFESHGFRGTLKQVPRIVVGAECDTVRQLAALWNSGDKAALAGHEIRNILQAEIATELETFLAYAEKNGKRNAARSFRQALGVLSLTKMRDGGLTSKTPADAMFQSILEGLKLFK
ncbi:hypothetical protein KC727_02365 [Candidatus Kaiserbacteria bacterium]|nr:hypothetical protein [Candidatus Kaiserbacteria bacterium]